MRKLVKPDLVYQAHGTEPNYTQLLALVSLGKFCRERENYIELYRDNIDYINIYIHIIYILFRIIFIFLIKYKLYNL